MRAGFRAERAAEHAAAQLKHHQSAPELPMLLVAAADAGRLSREDAHRAATLLLAEQLTDGSWPCDPYLRLTAPAAQASSTSGDGRIFAGSRRVFSTAHSITALDRLAATLAEPWQSKPA